MSLRENFYYNSKIDMPNIKDSMQIDSGTVIACLHGQHKFITLEVRGDVKVWFNPNKNEDPHDGEYYEWPSDFPDELKDLIAGKKLIWRKDNDTEGIEHIWSMDSRVDMCENNWFEIFVGANEKDPAPTATLVDAEGMTEDQIFQMLSELDVDDTDRRQ